jgi:tRNA-binding protein
MSESANWDDFERLGLRVGTIMRAEPNSGARDPSYRLWISLGDGSLVQSSAKITDRYRVEVLVGRQVVVVTGFQAIRVGGFRSDVLVLGAVCEDGVVLVRPDEAVPPGTAVA